MVAAMTAVPVPPVKPVAGSSLEGPKDYYRMRRVALAAATNLVMAPVSHITTKQLTPDVCHAVLALPLCKSVSSWRSGLPKVLEPSQAAAMDLRRASARMTVLATVLHRQHVLTGR